MQNRWFRPSRGKGLRIRCRVKSYGFDVLCKAQNCNADMHMLGLSVFIDSDALKVLILRATALFPLVYAFYFYRNTKS